MAHIKTLTFGGREWTNIGRRADDPTFRSGENLILRIRPVDIACEFTGANGYIHAELERQVTPDKPDLVACQVLMSASASNNAWASPDEWPTLIASNDEQDPEGESGQQRDVDSWELKRGIVVAAPRCSLDRETLVLRFYEGTYTRSEGGEPVIYSYHPELDSQEDED